MSGHNKWSKIKRQKGAADAKRSKAFSRILKEVTVAVKESGPDPDGNPRLRLLMQNAKGVNMPKDTLMRAISKASDKDSAALQELTFECYAPHGVAIFIEYCLPKSVAGRPSRVPSCQMKRPFWSLMRINS